MQGDKLSVLVAKEAPVALILRRGPTKWYHLMKWNLINDDIEHGAWIKARIYEDACDISFDGQYFLYKVFKSPNDDYTYKDSFTAISTVPWVKAHWLLPIGNTYVGGGFFADKKTIGIYQLPFCELNPHPNHTNDLGFNIYHSTDLFGGKPNCVAMTKPHDNENLIDDIDWSKKLADGSIIWHKHYHLYRRYFNSAESFEDKLIADLENLKPERVKAPY